MGTAVGEHTWARRRSLFLVVLLLVGMLAELLRFMLRLSPWLLLLMMLTGRQNISNIVLANTAQESTIISLSQQFTGVVF